MPEIKVVLSAKATRALNELEEATGASGTEVLVTALYNAYSMHRAVWTDWARLNYLVVLGQGSEKRVYFPLAERYNARQPGHHRWAALVHRVASEPSPSERGATSSVAVVNDETVAVLANMSIGLDLSTNRVINQAILDARLIAEFTAQGRKLGVADKIAGKGHIITPGISQMITDRLRRGVGNGGQQVA